MVSQARMHTATPPITSNDVDRKEQHPHTYNERRQLGGSGDDGGYLVDDNGNAYAPYSLSWRYLGMFIDNDCNNGRRLEDGGGNSACRKVLWAAYHDPGYAGNSIAEYQFYDRDNGSWDGSTCRARTYGLWWPFTRCRRLDCHLAGTKLDLVGVFKETDGLYDFTEQLFKHQGYCLWDEDKNNNNGSQDSGDHNSGSADNDDGSDVVYKKYSDYNFMTTLSENWVNGCTQLEDAVDDDGNYLYYDTKPLPGGDITYGVYTDASCLTESSRYTWADLNDNNNNGDESWMTSGAAFDRWNALLNDYKICQPCRAYNRVSTNQGGSHDGSGSGSDDEEDYEDGDDGEGGKERWGFNCYDDAGYRNCNQCYKFQTQTDMEPASYDDLRAATQQGTILAIKVDGTTYGRGFYRAPGRTRYVFTRTFVALLVIAGVYHWYRKNYNCRVGDNSNNPDLKDKLNTTSSEDDDNIHSSLTSMLAALRRFCSQNNPFSPSSATTATARNASTAIPIVVGNPVVAEHEKKVLLSKIKERDMKLAKQEELIQQLLQKIEHYESEKKARAQDHHQNSASSESITNNILQKIEHYESEKETRAQDHHQNSASCESSTNNVLLALKLRTQNGVLTPPTAPNSGQNKVSATVGQRDPTTNSSGRVIP